MEQFLIDWEGPVLLWIQEHMRNDFLTPVLTFLTHLGDHGYFWIALTILFLLLKKTRKVGGLMTCSLLLNTLVNNVLLKNLVARTRPYEVVDGLHRIIEAQSDYSFPSGHTGSAFAVGSRRISQEPEEDRRAGAGVCVCDCIFKTVCRRTFSDGRTGRSSDRSGDRISGLCRLPEKNRAEGINMELRALNDFLVIARGENITRAAEQLHVTPPTLSRQSADLEEVPGVKLCYRMTGCMCIYALRTSKSNQDSG